jgi:hypothetical protein
LTEVTDEVYGSATTIKIALSKLGVYSFEMVHLIQSFFKNFDIRKYPNQDVVTASQHAKSMGGILSITGDLPARAVQYILVGMAKSTNDRFNILCNQLMSQDEMTYQQPLPGRSTSQAVLKDLSTVSNHLTRVYWSAVQSGSWLTKSGSASSAFSGSVDMSVPGASNPSPALDINAFAAALASQLSGPSTDCPCNVCGLPDHWARKCPANKNANNKQKLQSQSNSRSNSRPNSCQGSQSRNNSHQPSRNSSRGRANDRPNTPYKARGNSRDNKSVAFEPSAYNVTLSESGGLTAGDLLRRFNLSKE